MGRGDSIEPASRGSSAEAGAVPYVAGPADAPTSPPDPGVLKGLRRRQLLTSLRERTSSLRPLAERRYRLALKAVDRVRDAESLREFIELHLQPRSGRQTDAHRAELVIRLARRMPVICASSKEDEVAKSFQDVLEMVFDLRDEQQREPLAALAEATRYMPKSASELRSKISMHAWNAWHQDTIDHRACIEIHAYLARSTVSADLFSNLQRTGNRRIEPVSAPALTPGGRIPVIDSPSVASEMHGVLDVMLQNVRAMSGDLKREWLLEIIGVEPSLSYFPFIATKLSRAMLQIARETPGEQGRELLIALARIEGFSWLWRDILESAQLARCPTAIDDNGHADILAALATSADGIRDPLDYEPVLEQLVDEIEQLPSQFRGRPYGSLLTSALEQHTVADDYRAPLTFKRAWWGLMSLGREGAETGLAMLREAEQLTPKNRLTIAEDVVGDIEGEQRKLLAPALRAIAPTLKALAPASANALLKRVLAMVDARTDICVRDFSTRDWRAAECAQIFEHMFPIVMNGLTEVNRDNTKQAQDLADLAVLAQGLSQDLLYDRFNQLAEALNQFADGLDTADKSPLSEPLRRMSELANRLPRPEQLADPSASQPSERSEAFKWVRQFAANRNIPL